MHPVLIELPIFGGFPIHTYGVMLALAVFQAAVLMRRWGDQDKLPGDELYDMAFWTLIGGLVGARLEYIRVSWPEFEGNYLMLLNLRKGGLVFYGGLIGAFLTFVVSAHRRKLPIARVLDVIAPVVPLGHFWGRMGCLAAGCCFGREAPGLSWAISFTDKHCWNPRGGLPNPEKLPVCLTDPLFTPLHPTQIYEALYSLGLGLFLIWMRKRRRFHGQLILLYLSLYPILRSINELYRGDTKRGFFMEAQLGQVVSNAQFLSLLIVLGSSVLGVIFWNLSKETSPVDDSKS